MESLGFFDLVWRVALAGALALTPGILFWTLALGLVTLAQRLRRWLWPLRPVRGAAQI